MNAPEEGALEVVPEGESPSAEALARQLGLDPALARKLADAGLLDPSSLRTVPREALLRAGLSPEEADQVLHAIGRDGPGGTTAQDDLLAEQLMRSVRRPGAKRRRAVPVARDSSEVLRRWVGGDDTAMDSWMRSATVGPLLRPETSEGAPPAAAAATAAPTLPPGPAPTRGAVSETAEQLVERERAVLAWLSELLDRAKSDRFDPPTVLEELRSAHRELVAERARRAQVEAEAEQVKRGSIAVIKYVRSREAAARELATRDKDAEIAALKVKLLPLGEGARSSERGAEAASALEARLRAEFAEREAAMAAREAELTEGLAEREAALHKVQAQAGSLEEREALLREQAKTLPEVVGARLRLLETREQEIAAREASLEAKLEQFKNAARASAEELERQRGPLRFKEEQLAQWELQLRTLKQTLEVEARTVEKARLDAGGLGGGGIDPAERQRLDDLKAEITRREDDLQSRERLLKQQIEDLSGQIASQDAEAMHQQATADARETRLATGVRRLDDLLFGGLPAGAQVLVGGPAHTGKELLARLFIAEGLKKGVPAIWVVADKTYTQVRDEMVGLLPSYRELEGKGLVRYVDLYSRGLGVNQSEPGVKLFNSTDKGVLEHVTQAVNAFSQELKEKAPSYRLVFESVSTVTAYLDTAATFRFLQPFTGRRRLDGAAGYYLLETGMHSESDLETLEHMVDGSINLKVEQLKTFLSVRGITDVQSRAWVGYTFTKRAFSLGSFSLDHIR
jgi:KaiC/GvpD/RAD55 family RecA-like ATPase